MIITCVDWYCNARNAEFSISLKSFGDNEKVENVFAVPKPVACMNTKTRVSNVVLQTKLTTDTVIPDNVLDREVAGF